MMKGPGARLLFTSIQDFLYHVEIFIVEMCLSHVCISIYLELTVSTRLRGFI